MEFTGRGFDVGRLLDRELDKLTPAEFVETMALLIKSASGDTDAESDEY